MFSASCICRCWRWRSSVAADAANSETDCRRFGCGPSVDAGVVDGCFASNSASALAKSKESWRHPVGDLPGIIHEEPVGRIGGELLLNQQVPVPFDRPVQVGDDRAAIREVRNIRGRLRADRCGYRKRRQRHRENCCACQP